MLTQYTSYDEIRAALGVAEEEIPNTVLSLPNYERVLELDLEDPVVDPTLQALFVTLTVSGYTPTVNESRYISIMKLYATYVVARHLLQTMSMFAPQVIKDSKTQMDRITDPYKSVKEGVESFYFMMRVKLLAAYGILFPNTISTTTTTFTAMTAVGLAVDPVTGT